MCTVWSCRGSVRVQQQQHSMKHLNLTKCITKSIDDNEYVDDDDDDDAFLNVFVSSANE